jgi:hypothetical protein
MTPTDPRQRSILELISLFAERDCEPRAEMIAQVLACAPWRLRPYIAYQLRPLVPGLPEILRDQIITIERQFALAFLKQQKDTRRILETLREHGVPVLLLKGAAIASQVYPSPSLRPITDLDLWVQAGAMPEAGRALGTIGLSHGWAEFGGLIDTNSQVVMRKPGALGVELHSPPLSLAGLPLSRLERMWERAVSVQCGTVSAITLQHEDLLTHLILHLAKAGFSDGIARLLDIALVLHRWQEEWDWPRLFAEWREDGVASSAIVALCIAHQLIGAPVPDSVVREGRSERFQQLETLAIEQLWRGESAIVKGALGNAVVPMPWTLLMRKLAWRVSGYYWSPPTASVKRPVTAAVRDAFARFAFDAQHRVPALARAIAKGGLHPGRVRERRMLWRDRQLLMDLLELPGQQGD